jgi:hypothetical protein
VLQVADGLVPLLVNPFKLWLKACFVGHGFWLRSGAQESLMLWGNRFHILYFRLLHQQG